MEATIDFLPLTPPQSDPENGQPRQPVCCPPRTLRFASAPAVSCRLQMGEHGVCMCHVTERVEQLPRQLFNKWNSR
jgi:hypothetical protein